MKPRLNQGRRIGIARSAESGKHDPEAAVREALRAEWNDYLSWRRKFLKKGSRKSVHHLRTSIRKLSSCLDLAGGTMEPKRARQLCELLERELDCLREVRDFQAQEKRLSVHHPGFLRWKKFRRHLERGAKKDLRRATKRIAKWGTGRQRRQLEALDHRLTARMSGRGGRSRRELLAGLKRRFEDTLLDFERLQLALRPGDHRTFHKLRLRVKDLDYKREAARGLLVVPAPLARRISGLRRRLGRLQDQVVFWETSKGYLRKGSAHPHPRRELERQIIQRERDLMGAPARSEAA